MGNIRARATNAFHVARLSIRYARFAKAIAARRLFEALYTTVPRLYSIIMPYTHPAEVVIALTSRCQLRCSICGIRKVMTRPQFKGHHIEPDELLPLLDEIAQWRWKPYLKFTGGEPLLLEEKLIKLIKTCHRRNIPTRLSTNGCLLEREDLASGLVESGLDVLTISLDGPEKVHNAIRGSSRAFSQTIQGIENVALAKNAIPSKTPLVQISSVIHAGNQASLRELFSLLQCLPIQWWNLQLLNFVDRETNRVANELAKAWGYEEGPWCEFTNEALCQVDAHALAEDIAWIQGQRTAFARSILRIGSLAPESISAYYRNGTKILKKKLCAAPLISIHIVPTGDMVFCIDYPYVVYGNIRESSLKAAWLSEKAMEFRKRFIAYYVKTGNPLPQCARCNWLFN